MHKYRKCRAACCPRDRDRDSRRAPARGQSQNRSPDHARWDNCGKEGPGRARTQGQAPAILLNLIWRAGRQRKPCPESKYSTWSRPVKPCIYREIPEGPRSLVFVGKQARQGRVSDEIFLGIEYGAGDSGDSVSPFDNDKPRPLLTQTANEFIAPGWRGPI